jgi:alkylhydroperoxidase family enzyme
MFLKEIVDATPQIPPQMPEIRNLLAYKPEATAHLDAFTQKVMRETTSLSAGECELLAAMTSKANHCVF